MKKKSLKTLVVSSSIESEGKTVTALNLSFTFSQDRSKKVLLLDADLRRSKSAEYLGLNKKQAGFIDVLEKIHDLLKSDGVFISETTCLGEKNKLTGRLLRFMGHLGLLPKINLLTTRQLEQALEKSGFRIVDKIRFSDNSDSEFTLFAKKPERGRTYATD